LDQVHSDLDMPSTLEVLARFEGRGRDALLEILHAVQPIHGWLPREVQAEVSSLLKVPLAEIHGVIEFYSMFYNKPMPRQIIRVCQDPACSMAGSEELISRLRQGSTVPESTVERVHCLGLCDQAPAALIGEVPAADIDSLFTGAHSAQTFPSTRILAYGERKHILKRVGVVDPSTLDSYLANGGYAVLRRVVGSTPDECIAMAEESGILGRGGAMFPMGMKWRFTRSADGPPSQKHIVINADESEPGTFKDRALLEGDPFAVIEAATIAGYAIGAERGWIFIRGEYPQAILAMRSAIGQARDAGYLGRNLLGQGGFNFDIELRVGAGAYICGEETALFEAIEGKRGFPRIKPPFPTTHGLFGQPTAINNVESLVAFLAAAEMGVDRWCELGTSESPGTKLFCLSGHVEKPGVYELPFGLTIGKMIETAGGVAGSGRFGAALIGGAAGSFIDAGGLDFELSYEGSRASNLSIGSGVVMVFDDSVDIRVILHQLSKFFAHESCGKCYPCQLGTQRQMELLAPDHLRLIGERNRGQLLEEIGNTMTLASLCGLGQTAASATLSAMELWPELLGQPGTRQHE